MIYTYKQYSEIKEEKIRNLPINNIAIALKNKSKLGNFVSQIGNIFNGKEIYELKKELDFLKQFEIKDESLIELIKAIDNIYNHINFSLEFLDKNKNNDLFLFSLTKSDNNNSLKNDLCLKLYELKQIAPILLTEEDLKSVFHEFDKWKYEKITNLLFYSQGIINNTEILEIKEELMKIKKQRLVSSKSLQLIEFFLKLKNKKSEEFLVLEKYISVYH